MPDFKKNFRPGGSRPSFSRGGSNSGPRGRSFEKKEMFDVECSNCHKPTQVPFRPNGKKPVFCKDCFVPEERTERPRFERRPPTRDFAAPRIEKDARIDDVLRRLDSIERSLEKMTDLIEGMQRKEALGAEVRKHLPVEKAPARKKVAKKKTA